MTGKEHYTRIPLSAVVSSGAAYITVISQYYMASLFYKASDSSIQTLYSLGSIQGVTVENDTIVIKASNAFSHKVYVFVF